MHGIIINITIDIVDDDVRNKIKENLKNEFLNPSIEEISKDEFVIFVDVSSLVIDYRIFEAVKKALEDAKYTDEATIDIFSHSSHFDYPEEKDEQNPESPATDGSIAK